MRLLLKLTRDIRGAAAIEMALALPVLVAAIYGIFQVGILYQASAGMQHALGEGARLATLCVQTREGCTPPSDAQIKERIASKLFGKGDGTFTVNDPVAGDGYRELSVTYSKRMNFLFIAGPNISLNRSKRAYTVS